MGYVSCDTAKLRNFSTLRNFKINAYQCIRLSLKIKKNEGCEVFSAFVRGQQTFDRSFLEDSACFVIIVFNKPFQHLMDTAAFI